MLQQRLDAAVQQALQQPADQRLAHATLVTDPPSGHLLGGHALGGGVAERGLRQRHVDPGGVGAELAADGHPLGPLPQLLEREEGRLQRPAAAGLPARLLGLVVGEPRDQLEDHRAVGLQVGDHLRAGVHERRREVRIDHPVGQRLDVGQGLLTGVGQARLGRPRVDGDPQGPARPGAGAADHVGLLQHQDLGPLDAGRQRGREAGGAGAEDDDVGHRVVIVFARHHRLPWNWTCGPPSGGPHVYLSCVLAYPAMSYSPSMTSA